MADAAPSAYSSLHPSDRAFVDEYLACGLNATEAARRLHYKHPHVQGPRLRNRLEIKAAIEERLGERKLSANDVLSRLSDKAEADMAYFLNVGADGAATLDLRKARRNGKLHLVRRVKLGKRGRVEAVELHDPRPYLDMLARYYKLLEPQEESTLADSIDLDWSDTPQEDDHG